MQERRVGVIGIAGDGESDGEGADGLADEPVYTLQGEDVCGGGGVVPGDDVVRVCYSEIPSHCILVRSVNGVARAREICTSGGLDHGPFGVR